jgi:hypothetical protein
MPYADRETVAKKGCHRDTSFQQRIIQDKINFALFCP